MITFFMWRCFLLPDVWREEHSFIHDPAWFRAFTCFAFTFSALILDAFVLTLLASMVAAR